MATTPALAFPYPDPSAPVANGAADIRALAERIEAVAVPMAARVELNTNQMVPSGAWTPVAFNLEVTDDRGMWAPAAPSRLVVPAAGWYVLSGGIEFYASAAGTVRHAQLYLGGVLPPNGKRLATASGFVTAAGAARVMLSTVLYLAAASIIELLVYHDVGASHAVGQAAVGEFRDNHLAIARLQLG